MARTISLQYAGTCKECGAALKPGDRARFYGRGRVYGTACHGDTRGAAPRGAHAPTHGRAALRVVSTRCEDYPCCGHGPESTGGDGGPCPRVYEDRNGHQSVTTPCAICGTDLPRSSCSSLCSPCLRRGALMDDPQAHDNAEAESVFQYGYGNR